MESQEENKTHHVPKWLKLIQENSWELELLISGGAIFTLFQVSDIWVQWLQSASFISFLPGRNMILLIGALGIEILKIGFISHLLLRAFWLSMVCINYAFPGGINKDKIKWKKPFKISVKENEDLQSSIVKVDRYCGLVIYLSVISTFLLAGMVFGIFCLVTLPTINQNTSQNTSLNRPCFFGPKLDRSGPPILPRRGPWNGRVLHSSRVGARDPL